MIAGGAFAEEAAPQLEEAQALSRAYDQDPALGYALMQRVSHVMYERLQDARMRLLDLYGSPS